MSEPVQKMVVIPGEVTLEGVHLAARGESRGGAVVAPPHPLYGGSMDHPIVSEVAFACSAAGFDALAFNWRGVGASQGRPSGEPGDADADYGATLEHLLAGQAGPVVACGYSFGAATAIRCAAARPEVRRVVLIAPPPALCDPESLARIGGPVLAITGERDELASPTAVEAMLAPLADAELRVIADADHFFMAGLAEVGARVRDALA